MARASPKGCPAVAPRLFWELMRHLSDGSPARGLEASSALFRCWSQWKLLTSRTNTPPPLFCARTPASRRSAVVAPATPARLVELSGTVTEADKAAEVAAKQQMDAARTARMVMPFVVDVRLCPAVPAPARGTGHRAPRSCDTGRRRRRPATAAPPALAARTLRRRGRQARSRARACRQSRGAPAPRARRQSLPPLPR